MSIEMPAEEVRAWGRALSGRAGTADEVRARMTGGGEVAGSLGGPVSWFLECQAVLAAALADELRWLGATVTEVADSWVALDADLLPPPGEVQPR